MNPYVFIDESKATNYLLVASVVAPSDLSRLRALLDELKHRGERGVHMRKERPAHRRRIAEAIAGSPVRAVVYDAGRSGTELVRRQACLARLVEDHRDVGAHLVIDRDESLVRWDRQQLIELVRATGCSDRLTYEHGKASETAPLLALPDVVAWCWARGGDFRRTISPVAEHRRISF